MRVEAAMACPACAAAADVRGSEALSALTAMPAMPSELSIRAPEISAPEMVLDLRAMETSCHVKRDGVGERSPGVFPP
jgi:hypothetical protein